jgi:hypothetical protein
MMPKGIAPVTLIIFICCVNIVALAALLFEPKAGEDLRADIGIGVSGSVSHVRSTGKN